jgi:hypothetical protein
LAAAAAVEDADDQAVGVGEVSKDGAHFFGAEHGGGAGAWLGWRRCGCRGLGLGPADTERGGH